MFLFARDEESLVRAAGEIRRAAGEAEYAVGDVADVEALRAAATACARAFGGIDTWVNDAGVSAYARLTELPAEDARRIFETNYWGAVHGCLTALPPLRTRGGAIVNVGSVLSDRAIPLQGHYCASKHAVKGFTDALRMELRKDDWPVSVSLVKPSAINTPYLEHAGNRMGVEPSLPPPVYAPEVVADAILACAEKPVRSVTVGGGGRMLAVLGAVAPRLTDAYMEAFVWDQQKGDGPQTIRPEGALHAPLPGRGHAHGPYEGHVARSSVYTAAKLHPALRLGALAGIAAGAALGMRAR